MNLRKSLLGLVAGAGMFLGSANQLYSQVSLPNQREIKLIDREIKNHRASEYSYKGVSEHNQRDYKVPGGDRGDDLLAPMALLIFLQLHKYEKRKTK